MQREKDKSKWCLRGPDPRSPVPPLCVPGPEAVASDGCEHHRTGVRSHHNRTPSLEERAMTSPVLLADARHLRGRADEMRAVAKGMRDPNCKQAALRIADDYESLAKAAEERGIFHKTRYANPSTRSW